MPGNYISALSFLNISENIRGSRSITRPWVPGVVQGHPFMGRAKATVDSRQGNSSPEAQSHCFPGSLEFQSQVPMVSAIHNGKGMGTLGHRSELHYWAQREATRREGDLCTCLAGTSCLPTGPPPHLSQCSASRCQAAQSLLPSTELGQVWRGRGRSRSKGLRTANLSLPG